MIIEYLESVDSTNNEWKRRLASGESIDGFSVLSAGEQTAGRGRSGHTWSSPAGASAASSMLLFPEGLSEQMIPALTILAALAVTEAVEQVTGLSCKIKWPNDVLMDEHKVCGILTERIPGEKTAVIVGIGVNLHPGSYPPELANMATCLDEAMAAHGMTDPSGGSAQCSVDRDEFVKTIWERFIDLYERLCKCGDLSDLCDTYNHKLINAGREIIIESGEERSSAIAQGIDPFGRLIVEKDGIRQTVDSGEVHVRGVYGYV